MLPELGNVAEAIRVLVEPRSRCSHLLSPSPRKYNAMEARKNAAVIPITLAPVSLALSMASKMSTGTST